jgi:hypothetical protein
LNYRDATLALEGWFATQWGGRTLVSYESGNIPLPEQRPTAHESWLRFTLAGVGTGFRSVGRGEPWTRWSFLAIHQLFTPPQTGHDVADGYISDLVSVWRDLAVPSAGARWVVLDPPYAPTARQEREWYQTNLTISLQLEWR